MGGPPRGSLMDAPKGSPQMAYSLPHKQFHGSSGTVPGCWDATQSRESISELSRSCRGTAVGDPWGVHGGVLWGEPPRRSPKEATKGSPQMAPRSPTSNSTTVPGQFQDARTHKTRKCFGTILELTWNCCGGSSLGDPLGGNYQGSLRAPPKGSPQMAPQTRP